MEKYIVPVGYQMGRSYTVIYPTCRRLVAVVTVLYGMRISPYPVSLLRSRFRPPRVREWGGGGGGVWDYCLADLRAMFLSHQTYVQSGVTCSRVSMPLYVLSSPVANRPPMIPAQNVYPYCYKPMEEERSWERGCSASSTN